MLHIWFMLYRNAVSNLLNCSVVAYTRKFQDKSISRPLRINEGRRSGQINALYDIPK